MATRGRPRKNTIRERDALADQYKPPSQVDVPDEVRQRFRTLGKELKFVRFKLGPDDDSRNVAKRLQEGYTFIKREDVPELENMLHTDSTTRWGGELLTVGDLVLMALPIEKNEARKAYYNRRGAEQLEAINTQVRKQVPGLINESESYTRTGRDARFVD